MMTVTVSPAQAQELAAQLATAERAQQRAVETLRLLTLGHVPPNTTLSGIDQTTGVLTLVAVPDAD